MISKDSKILVTGGKGFLGEALIESLIKRGYRRIETFRHSEFDLTLEKDVARLFQERGPFQGVIHLAAAVGGIAYNKKNPGKVFYENIMMNTFLQEYALRYKVGKFVGIGSVCSYPKILPVPFKEESLWAGYPEETNATYGLAKKMMLVQSQAYREQYGFNAIHLLMVNLYGPRDNFDLADSHVIPALIRKFVESKKLGREEVTLWGTGSASREFLFVEDAAEAIVLALESYNKPSPVNIGSGMEITIKDLANTIARLVGFNGIVSWDSTKPDGQPRRALDVEKAKREFGFSAKTDLKAGLQKTIEWFVKNQSNE